MLKVNSEKLAAFLDANVIDLPLLVDAGMPEPDEDGEFEFLSALHWYIQRQREIANSESTGTRESNAEALRVQTDLRVQGQAALEQLHLGVERGELVLLDEFNDAARQKWMILREKILGLPSRYAHRLEGRTEPEVRQVFRSILKDISPKAVSS